MFLAELPLRFFEIIVWRFSRFLGYNL